MQLARVSLELGPRQTYPHESRNGDARRGAREMHHVTLGAPGDLLHEPLEVRGCVLVDDGTRRVRSDERTDQPAQLAMLLEGIDWRTPTRTWRPLKAG